MHDDELRNLLRSLETDREPDPAFADALFNRLTVVAGDERPRPLFILLAAALMLTALAAGAALGSGLIRLPLTVDATRSPSPTASGVAVASPSESVMPNPSEASAEPSAPVAPVASGSVLFAAADGLRLRADPSGAAEILATLRSGQLMGVVSGPTSADGIDWYEVRIGPGDTQGWVAAGPDNDWLRLVTDGAVMFSCSGCLDPGADPQEQNPMVVAVSPFADGVITAVAENVSQWRVSPDGERITATAQTDSGSTVIVMNADGSGRADIGPGGYAPSWSRDGSRLAWTTGEVLVVTDADLAPSELDLGVRNAGAPRWSPDGTLIGFGALDCPECPPDEPIIGDPPSATWLVGADGSSLRQLTGGDYSGLVDWSPDGSTLSFVQHDLSGEFPTRAYLMSVEDGERRYLLDGGAVHDAGRWSPSGTQLALPTPEGLVVTDGEGNGERLLFATGAVIGDVRWSPSGNWLVYTASEGPDVGLWIVRSDGSEEPRRISPVDSSAGNAEWQPILVDLP